MGRRITVTGPVSSFQVVEHGTCLSIAQAQIGHVHLFVFREQGRGYGVFFRQHFFRRLDEAGEPRPVTDAGHTMQIRSDPVATADAVAGGALGRKYVLAPVVYGEPGRLGVALPCPGPSFPTVEPIADHHGEVARIVQPGVANPLAGPLVAEKNTGRMAVAV